MGKPFGAANQFARAVDENQSEIVDALRHAGYQVVICSGVGAGFPDLIVTRTVRDRRFAWFVEVIGEAKAKNYRKTGGLTDRQVEFHRAWRGPEIHKVHSIEEAYAVVGVTAR